MTQTLVSHGPDGMWLTCYVAIGNSRLQAVTVLTITEAEALIGELHRGIADELAGHYGDPAERGMAR